MEKRKKKISRIYIGAGCITVLILLGVVIHGVKQFTAENADTKKGIEYIQSKENEEVKVIEQKIASLEAKDPASGDTERSLKDRFSGAVVMGDSISSGFSDNSIGIWVIVSDEMLLATNYAEWITGGWMCRGRAIIDCVMGWIYFQTCEYRRYSFEYYRSIGRIWGI